MGIHGHEAATVEEHHPIALPDGGQPVTHHENDPRNPPFPERTPETILVLRIEGDRWTLLGEFQPGHLEAGDLGSLAYEDGHLVTTSDSEGCPGCVSELTWSRHGDTVALERVTGASVVAMDRFIWLGRWQRA